MQSISKLVRFWSVRCARGCGQSKADSRIRLPATNLTAGYLRSSDRSWDGAVAEQVRAEWQHWVVTVIQLRRPERPVHSDCCRSRWDSREAGLVALPASEGMRAIRHGFRIADIRRSRSTGAVTCVKRTLAAGHGELSGGRWSEAGVEPVRIAIVAQGMLYPGASGENL
jgi:hypothetical protein